MSEIINPVLRGFNPDPSIVRVGADYFIATSTFEWWPGVRLHHSRDLVHWRFIGHALTRSSQLTLQGIPDSGGVWAPSLSHADGRFWLIYTNVRTCGLGRPFKDLRIHLITSTDIAGPWSDPITLNSVGFDPSLFHDDDGRKWLVNMLWDFRPGRKRFAGIVIQEYDPRTAQLIGPLTKIYSSETLIEGPNLYRRNGWYYLMLAEGGTGWNHGITIARSRAITGPYEPDPQHDLLTTRDAPDHPLQKAGHGELVETPTGEWYLAHLASRPLDLGRIDPARPPLDRHPAAPERLRRCPLGRETCLQRVRWTDDGWLRLAHGHTHPQLTVASPCNTPAVPWLADAPRDDFDSPTLNARWNTLRAPACETWASLHARPGWLRLHGRDSLHSLFEQSLVAQRVTEHRARALTRLQFTPTHFTQSAGLVCYYDTRGHYYLRVTHDENRGRILGVVLSDEGVYQEPEDASLDVNDWTEFHLGAELDESNLRFHASPDGVNWSQVGGVYDASKLSDDYGAALRFTGLFIGICAQDVGGAGSFADFDYFSLSH